jgi:HNH endonuclease/NUMOD4 motif-containing protein
MQREIKFRACEEFPKYEIGDNGTVFSLDYNHSGKRKILKQHLDTYGYPYVFLVVDGKRYKRSVHRLVSIAFIPNLENKPQVNHKNGIRNDNRLENLEWVTSQENCIHSYKVNGRKPSITQIEHGKKIFTGENNPKAKVNEAVVLSIRRLRSKGILLKDIAERHNISVSQVSAIASNKFWKYVKPAAKDGFTNTMQDPNLKQEEATGAEETQEAEAVASEQVIESAEEGTTEG